MMHFIGSRNHKNQQAERERERERAQNWKTTWPNSGKDVNCNLGMEWPNINGLAIVFFFFWMGMGWPFLMLTEKWKLHDLQSQFYSKATHQRETHLRRTTFFCLSSITLRNIFNGHVYDLNIFHSIIIIKLSQKPYQKYIYIPKKKKITPIGAEPS